MKVDCKLGSGLPWVRGMAVAACLTIASLTGCGGGADTVPIKGKVTHDGQPVNGGSITFAPIASEGIEAGKPASGTVGADGSFTLTTFEENDGAVVGKHRVLYSAPAVEAAAATSGGGHAAAAPPSPLAGLKAEPAEVEVTSSTTEITIELVPGV